jgi:hypothetical protein
VVLLTGVFLVAVFAIPALMLTWGFEAEAESRDKDHEETFGEEARSGAQNSDRATVVEMLPQLPILVASAHLMRRIWR